MLKSIFTKDVVEKWNRVKSPSWELQLRLAVVKSQYGETDVNSTFDPAFLPAKADIWGRYLKAALEAGLFEGEQGKELTQRLIGKKDENFHSATSECMACWFFKERLNLLVKPKPFGRRGKVLDLAVISQDVEMKVEVKTPYEKTRIGETVISDNENQMQETLERANKQFSAGSINILFIAPKLSTPANNSMLTNAFYFVNKVIITFDNKTGNQIGPGRIKPFPEGQFLNTRFEPDGKPRFTRVSAIICVEEILKSLNYEPCKMQIDHNVYILHNPHAINQAPRDIWEDYPQYYEHDDGYLKWSNT